MHLSTRSEQKFFCFYQHSLSGSVSLALGVTSRCKFFTADSNSSTSLSAIRAESVQFALSHKSLARFDSCSNVYCFICLASFDEASSVRFQHCWLFCSPACTASTTLWWTDDEPVSFEALQEALKSTPVLSV